MDKKKLMMTYPPLTAWQWQANILSILWGRQDTYDWLFSNYIIPICSIDDWSKGEKLFLDYIPHPFFDNCPWISCRVIDREMIRKGWKNTRDFIIDNINKNTYVFTLVNIGRIVNDNRKYLHEICIFGYNQNQNIVNIADFFDNKYAYKEFNFDTVCQAIDDITPDEDYWDEYRGGIYLLKYIDNIGYEFIPQFVKNCFLLYISPQHMFSIIDMQSSRHKDNKISYGIDVCDKLVNQIERTIEKHFIWDQRAFHNYFDHKVMMVKRIEYMHERNFLKNKLISIEEFVWIRNESAKLYNLCLKMNIKKVWDRDIANRMINTLHKIKEKEMKLYEEVAFNLSI